MNCILNTGEKNLIVSNADLFEKLVKPQVFAVQDTNGQYSSLEEIKSTLKSFLEETFDITIEDDTEDFFDLGADSLTIINSIPKIDKLLGIKIAVNDFYENATLKKLSETLFVKSNEGLLKTKGKVAVKLSEGTHKIFAFPPAIGIGFLSYANLPAFFPRYSIHAMNFLTDADRIEQYCAYITERSAHEKVILLGYSAGGTLAFEVAKALGQNKVSCLIILDSYIYRKRYSHDKKARQALSDFFQQTKINYGAETFKAVTSSMARYYFYVNNLVSDGKVDADIHLLKAMDRDAEELKNRQYVQSNNLKNNYKTWDQLTSGRYYEYNGTGVHNTLFNPGNFEQNMHLVQKMLL
jgi:acyl carrier protein